MSDKQWYIFYVKDRYGLHRYLLQHYVVGDFESLKKYNRWLSEMRRYFIARTGIQHPRIISIEQSEVTGVYDYQPAKEI